MQRPAPRLASALVSGLLLAASAAAQEGSSWTRPKWAVNPQDEDWSGVGSLAAGERDWSDDLKWMALDDDGRWRLSLGGRLRGRFEAWSNFGLTESGVPRSDDVFLLLRARAHADLQHETGFRAYVELKSALAEDRDLPGGTRPVDEDQFDLHQGFLQHRLELSGDDDLVVRVGRQSLAYGRQRLISPLPWANALRTWDGVLAQVPLGDWNVDVFWTEFVSVDRNEFNEAGGDELFGLYGSRPGDGAALDLYLLGVQRDDRSLNGTVGDEDRYTLGARYARAPRIGDRDFEVEFAVQEGDVGSGAMSEDIHAWTLGGELGYTFEGARRPRLRALLDVGSGDSSPGGSVGTFDPPYPWGHGFYGIQDVVGRQNAIDFGLGGTWQLDERRSLAVTFHQFIRSQDGDTVYTPGGMPIAGTTGGSSDIGQEIDVVLTGSVDRHLGWQAGYAHFFGGSVFEDAGLTADADFLYFQLSYAF